MKTADKNREKTVKMSWELFLLKPKTVLVDKLSMLIYFFEGKFP